MKVELMKQNKNTPVVRVASAALAAFVLLFSLCFPSFASSVNGIDFSDQPLYQSSSVLTGNSSNFSLCTPAYETNSTIFSFYDSPWGNYDTGDVFMFYVASVGTYGALYFAGTNPMSVYRMTHSKSNPNSYSADSSPASNMASFDSSTSLYYGQFQISGNAPTVISCPSYNSLADGLADVASISSGGTPAHIAVTLKPGYVGYFDISNLSNVSVTLGTSLFSGAKYPGFSTDQSIGTVLSLPSGSFSLPIAGTSSISWAGSGQKDLIGRYSSFSYSHVYTSAGGSTYLVVVNPLSGSAPVLSSLGASGSNRNGNITVLIDQCRGSKIYSLTESLSIGSGSLDTESNGTSVNDGVYDPDTGSWDFTDPSTGLPEDPSSLPVGGGNDPIIGGNGGNTINEWLEDIANSIKSFFSGAIGAVTTLVSSGSDFIHSLSGLYAWLPGPVYSVLVSALILVITIGVIKVFI